MNCVLFTHDFPFGNAETFLELEINYTSKYFDNIYILSLSSNTTITRSFPSNVHPIKLPIRKHFIRLLLFALLKLFTWEVFNEYLNVRKLKHQPSAFSMFKEWLHFFMLERHYSIFLKKLNLKKEDTILYSYWLSAGAYIIAKNSTLGQYRIARAHAFEIRDYEQYIPFRQIIDSNLDEICFISEFTKVHYNQILQSIRLNNICAKQSINRLGVLCEYGRIKQKYIPPFQIVSCASINSIKRLDIMVDLLSKLDLDIAIKWTHFGWGPEGEKIKAMCHNLLNNKYNISWELKGIISNNEILDFYKNNRIDLFVNTSDNEGVPVSIMEAMSFGIPCLARNVGGISEIISNGVNGYLLDPNISNEEMADKLTYFIQQLIADNVGNKFYLSSLEYIHKYHNAETNFTDFYNKFNQLTNKSV